MNEIFPFALFPYLAQYDATYFTYSPENETFKDAIVKAQLQYRPGAYIVSDYSDGLGEYLYVGESGFKNGRLVEQQLPYRIFKATCVLPNAYPDCKNKREVKRADGWMHMMTHDNLSKIIFFIFYSPLINQNGNLVCNPTPVQLQNQITATINQTGQITFRWSSREL